MYIINILVPFELIIDIDLGLIKLVRFHYNNGKYFYRGITKGPDNGIRYLLMNREDPNPLSIAYINRDTDKETMDSFYDQFMEREYESILKLSPGTSVLDVMGIANADKDHVVRFTVLCKNELEKDVITNRKIPAHNIIVSTPEDVDLSKFNCIYVKKWDDLDKYRGIVSKEIYIPNYKFNVTYENNEPQPILPIDMVTKYASDNEISVFTIYALNPKDIPVG